MKQLGTTIAVIALACFCGLNVAHADTLELDVVDTGPDAIIVARDLKLASESLKVRSNRIEVSLVGKVPAQSTTVDDSTIAQLGIRIRSTGERRLTITIKAGRDMARRLARRAVVRQVGDSVQLILARKIGLEPVATFIEDLDEDNEEPKEAALTVAEDKPAAAAPVTTTPPANAAPTADTTPKNSPGGATSIIGLLLVFAAAVACGLGYREWQKRRSSAPALNGIDVLSVRNIGPKTRLMLVAVGNREMLLTVGPAGSNVLGRWSRNAAASPALEDDFAAHQAAPIEEPPMPYREPAPAARPIASPPTANRAYDARGFGAPQRTARRQPTEQPMTARRPYPRGSNNPDEAVAEWNPRPTSPAIRGILELRDQTLALDSVLGQSDDDVDTEWEQALAGGTRAGRLR